VRSFPSGIALALILGATALAGALEPGDQPIPLSEWREMTTGKTVWYSIDGALWGREYFHPDGARATFVTEDGECMTAPWAFYNGLYCFAYSGTDCFRHVRRDGRLLAIPDGDAGAAQVIEKITDTPLSCEAPLSS